MINMIFKYGKKSPWAPTLTELFPKIQPDAGSWLGTKNALYYCAQSANSFSWVLFVSRTRRLLSRSRLLWFMHQRNARNQETFSLNSIQFSLESVTSCVNIREFLKETTTTDNHTKTSHGKGKSIHIFSVSIIIIPTRLLCQMQANLNFYQPYQSSWREWILSLLVYVLHKTWLIRHFHG